MRLTENICNASLWCILYTAKPFDSSMPVWMINRVDKNDTDIRSFSVYMVILKGNYLSYIQSFRCVVTVLANPVHTVYLYSLSMLNNVSEASASLQKRPNTNVYYYYCANCSANTQRSLRITVTQPALTAKVSYMLLTTTNTTQQNEPLPSNCRPYVVQMLSILLIATITTQQNESALISCSLATLTHHNHAWKRADSFQQEPVRAHPPH